MRLLAALDAIERELMGERDGKSYTPSKKYQILRSMGLFRDSFAFHFGMRAWVARAARARAPARPRA